ncbi:ChaB family protein [Bradyrhizobium sp. 26S5]|uniref:ChaB family protein n=1 Tax=Bradyrhizobium sp. 26S5 TaxID=3139729 RepID=UPI0030D0CBEA
MYREALNHGFAAHADDRRQEKLAYRTAWSAVKRSHVKDGDHWVARAPPRWPVRPIRYNYSTGNCADCGDQPASEGGENSRSCGSRLKRLVRHQQADWSLLQQARVMPPNIHSPSRVCP